MFDRKVPAVMAPVSSAESVLRKAASLVGGDREATHGDKVDNHENIASLWNAYLDLKNIEAAITAHDVAIMMVLLKAARTKTGSLNLDDYVDMAGYAGVAAEIASRD